MRERLCVAAGTVQGPAKNFLVAMLVRDLTVTRKYYRQPQENQVVMLQALADDIVSLYDLMPYDIRSLNLFSELAMLKGLSWTMATVALASPRILLDHRPPHRAVKLPTMCVRSFETEDDLIVLWAQCYDRLATSVLTDDLTSGVCIALIREAVADNRKLTEIVKDFTPLVED